MFLWFLDVSGSKPKKPSFHKPKKKKKVVRRQPKKISAFKLKTSKKSKPKRKSKSLPELKSLPESKLKLKQNRLINTQRPSPHLKSLSSRPPSESPPSRPQSQKPQLHLKSKYKWNKTQNQNFSQSRPPQPRPKTHFKIKSKRMTSQEQNMSHREVLPSKFRPVPLPVWDTSVQAAIRVRDWKLLTGYPGHGDWVPPQVEQNITTHLMLDLHHRSRCLISDLLPISDFDWLLTPTFKSASYPISAFTPASLLLTLETIHMQRRNLVKLLPNNRTKQYFGDRDKILIEATSF